MTLACRNDRTHFLGGVRRVSTALPSDLLALECCFQAKQWTSCKAMRQTDRWRRVNKATQWVAEDELRTTGRPDDCRLRLRGMIDGTTDAIEAKRSKGNYQYP